MKKLRVLSLIVVMSMLLVACKGKEPEASVSVSEEATVSVSEETTVSAEETDKPDETEVEATQFTELTLEECKAFEEFFARMDTYGFLASCYSDIKDVDLFEVFYNGAGNAYYPTPEEEQAYLDAMGYTEMEVSIFGVTSEYMDKLLYERTGYSYIEFNNLMNVYYCDSANAYLWGAGDTNYVKYNVISGKAFDDTYILRIHETEDFDIYSNGGFTSYDKEVALKKVGDSYQFLSNQLIIQDGLIEEFCFAVPTLTYGEISVFANYPTEEGYDYTIAVVAGENLVQTVYNGSIGNKLTNKKFLSIIDMGFCDYDDDGCLEMGVMAKYEQDGNDIVEIRIYEYDTSYFTYDESGTELASMLLTNSSMAPAGMNDVFPYMQEMSCGAFADWKGTIIAEVEAAPDYLDGKYSGFTFIYLDDDNIPEVVRVNDSEAEGCDIYTSYDGITYVTKTDRLHFTYLYKRGLLCNSEGLMGSYYDIVYQLVEGQLYQIGHGERVEDYENADADGNCPVSYKWNDKEVSEEEYYKSLSEVYNTEYGASTYSYSELLSKDEMLRMLRGEYRRLFE